MTYIENFDNICSPIKPQLPYPLQMSMSPISRHALALLLTATSLALSGQTLPPTIILDPVKHRMTTDGRQAGSIYQEHLIREVHLTFEQPDFWQQLTDNYPSGTDLPATMSVDGQVFPNVGVRFKGQTSYSQVQNSQKKSFNITLDYADPDQRWEGYETLNFNNAFQDPTFMREVLYLHQIRRHIPAAKACYVRLYINGEDWGLYPHVQQLNGEYIREWFWSNGGTRWRADRPDGLPPGPGGGGGWGDGTAALNWLGPDSAAYQTYYTLKKTSKSEPWEDLIKVCDVLNNTPQDQLLQVLPDYLDLDRTLWFLASEILFSDDDSYVYKGKMDYYLYWDPETGRMTPLEFDGNSVLLPMNSTWPPFYNANKVNYPLLNRLLAVPEIRQRYLAHFRTLLADIFHPADLHALIDTYDALIRDEVQSDPKKLYPFNAYVNELGALKSRITNRYNFLSNHAEIAQQVPVITEVTMASTGGLWARPEDGEEALIRAQVSGPAGVSRVRVFWSDALNGNFQSLPLYDDGTHGDELAGDGNYANTLPGLPGGTWVRFYIEAASDNPARSVVFHPAGAEHDVFFFQVRTKEEDLTSVVINELMADNASTIKDPAGEFDDWIELYNRGDQVVDLSGWYLSDKTDNPTKWTFPSGTSIGPGDYLIVWADENGSQGPLHANFKLSKSGEAVILTAPDLTLVDEVIFGSQETDLGYARRPNGTGPFVIQAPTFGASNDLVSSLDEAIGPGQWMAFPNPARDRIILRAAEDHLALTLHDALGRTQWTGIWTSASAIHLDHLPAGWYILRAAGYPPLRILKH